MKTRAILSLAGAALLASVGAASASLLIVPSPGTGGIQATGETVSDGGPGFPCATCTANPVTTYGYASGASLQAADTGYYKFTFEGSGNSAATNTFSLGSPATTFTSYPTGGTGIGSTPAGTSFTEFLTAGTPIGFTLVSSGGCTITDGSGSPSSGCNYLVAMANSPSSLGALGPQSTAWIGFSDGGSSNDADFQDMVVRVDQIPEPASVAVFGAGLLALGLIRRRKAV